MSMISIFVTYVFNMLKEFNFIDKKIDQQLEFVISSLIYFFYLTIMIILGLLIYTANGPVIAFYLLFIFIVLSSVIFILLIPIFKELYYFQMTFGPNRKKLLSRLFFLKEVSLLVLVLENSLFIPFYIVFFCFDKYVFINTIILVQLVAIATVLSQTVRLERAQKLGIINKLLRIFLFLMTFFLIRYIRSIDFIKSIFEDNIRFLDYKKFIQEVSGYFLTVVRVGMLVSIFFVVFFLCVRETKVVNGDVEGIRYRNSLYATTFGIAALSGFLSFSVSISDLFSAGVFLSSALYYTNYFDLFYFGCLLNTKCNIFYMLYIFKIPMIIVSFIIFINICAGYTFSFFEVLISIILLFLYFVLQSLVVPKILKIIIDNFSLEIIWYRRVSFVMLLIMNSVVIEIYNLLS